MHECIDIYKRLRVFFTIDGHRLWNLTHCTCSSTSAKNSDFNEHKPSCRIQILLLRPSFPVGKRSIVISVCVSVFVCLSICLSACISQEERRLDSINQSIIYLLITHQMVNNTSIKTRRAGQPGTRCTYGCPCKRHKISKGSWKTSTNV